MELYFKDNFFSSGESDIMNTAGEVIGRIDLKSAFSSSLDVYVSSGQLACTGKFRMLLNKWVIADRRDIQLGVLSRRMSFLKKKYEYETDNRGIFEITSPAFSKEYIIQKSNGENVASFSRINNWLQSGAFRLCNDAKELDSYELVAVVMGVHEIQKRDKHN
ncbi:hypothetical protein [Paenibacillus crassostreae]|uniref:LURP-one-related family protein n=1 Tax=Paenibacillus crassostreae TaxID=1763538 RepID=A0A167G2T4_9BACL|nr:hypothetical protein [Paenibacillus crassostreae]AOZ93816.1 hypothetical protein LPB68_17600 [Paenibacillus crassostreae]OAB77151.1 hypothetical protein PNBC_07135 [Paenibacillus crassostreae]